MLSVALDILEGVGPLAGLTMLLEFIIAVMVLAMYWRGIPGEPK